MRYILIPVLVMCGFARTPSRSDLLDLSQAVMLKSPIPCDGATNPQQEVILDAHFSAGGWQRAFIVDNYQDQSCRADIGIKCFKHVPAGWRDDLTMDADGVRHYWLNSCRTWGSKDPAQYTLSGWYKEGPAIKKKLQWKQIALKHVPAEPEVYEFTDPSGGTAKVQVTHR